MHRILSRLTTLFSVRCREGIAACDVLIFALALKPTSDERPDALQLSGKVRTIVNDMMGRMASCLARLRLFHAA